jgi:hypothetical protein
MNSRPFCRSSVDHASISPASSNSFSQVKNIGDSSSNARIYSDNHSRPSAHSPTSCPPSISSLMSSMSLQTFTNFIPLSWSSSQQPSAVPTISSLSHGTSNGIREVIVVPDATSSRKCGYVTRKKQLELLKAQMDMKGMGTMRTSVQCKKCDGDLVFI